MSVNDVKLIALDLDGTLLNSDKALTARTRAALESAAERGVRIVPATGRFYRGMPEAVRALPFVRYAITMNGAQVLDAETGETIYSADIPTEEALAFYEHLDTLPVIYDCYIDGWGYMTASMQERAEDYVGGDLHLLNMIRELRSPVPELKAYIAEGRCRPQKMQLFTPDAAFRDALLPRLTERCPQFAVSTSLRCNIEVNSRAADKGRALLALAERLGVRREQTAAFGDGLNDLSMIRAAGVGVAMANGHPEVRAAADMLTDDCDADGVAKGIERLLDMGEEQKRVF